MSAAGRRAGMIAALVALMTLIAGAPYLLRRVDAFRVQRVEIAGTRYLAPHEALAVSGITRASNLFDDRRAWRRALLAHPLVDSVAIERRLPGTLVLRLTETEPVALVRSAELRMVDAAGRVLPVDPAGLAIDLPIVATGEMAEPAAAPDAAAEPSAVLADTTAIALVALADRLRRLEPAVAARVSEIHAFDRAAARLVLRDPAGAELLVPWPVTARRLRDLRLTLADLDARRDLERLRRVDLRFRNQVVVSFTSNAAS